MSDMMSEFIVESSDSLDLIDRHLIALEADPDNPDLLTDVFRALHTIKGGCGFYGLDRLEQVVHSAENLLSLLRDHSLSFGPSIADALLATVDMVRSILVAIERTGEEGEPDVDHLTQRLDELAAPQTRAATGPETPVDEPNPAPQGLEAESAQVEPWPDTGTHDDTTSQDRPDTGTDPQPSDGMSDPAAPTDSPPGPRIGDLLVMAGEVERDDVELAAAEQGLGDSRPIGNILVDRGSTTAEAVERVATAQTRPPAIADSTIRVDIGLLDQLMNMVGELVLSRNEMIRLATEHDDSVFGPPAQRLDLITSELQEGILKTRMQPIGTAWSKLPRVVRDLSKQLGKEIAIEMTGQETELDRTIIEAIRDPLTHIIRNIVDHGIEEPATRLEVGKHREGTLTLVARHQGEQVVIEISDDGRGIDPKRILKIAVERGVVEAGDAASLTEQEIINLVFRPGFSTASAVTNISGRGVGMDVVKSNVERIGGSVDLWSRVGQGTTFAIKIPLTLAIIPALTVRGGGASYAIPQANVVELVRLRADGPGRLEDIHGTPVYRLRGRLLPIVDLREQLGLEPIETKTTNIAVVKSDTLQFGLVVDGIDDNGEIVVKPLGQQVKDLKLFSGATILGNGRVALILDLLGLADRAGLLSASPAVNEIEAQRSREGRAQRSIDAEAMIVLSVGNGERVAIGLDAIDRLEEIQAESIERSDGRPVVQYRRTLMPLVDLGQVIGLGGSALTDRKRINVVVCLHHGRTVGLAVDQILDIVHSDGIQPTGKPGTVIIDGMVTDLVSPETVIAASLPALHRVDEWAGDVADPVPQSDLATIGGFS